MLSRSGSLAETAGTADDAGFNSETWNTGWIEEVGGSSSLYATAPILDSTLKGPKYLKHSLWWERGANDDCM